MDQSSIPTGPAAQSIYCVTVEAYNLPDNSVFFMKMTEVYKNLQQANASARQCVLFGAADNDFTPNASEIAYGEKKSGWSDKDCGFLANSGYHVAETKTVFDHNGCIAFTAWFETQSTGNKRNRKMRPRRVVGYVTKIELSDSKKPLTPEVSANINRYMSKTFLNSLKREPPANEVLDGQGRNVRPRHMQPEGSVNQKQAVSPPCSIKGYSTRRWCTDRATSPEKEPTVQKSGLLIKLEDLEGPNAETMKTKMGEGLKSALAGLETYSKALRAYDQQFNDAHAYKEKDVELKDAVLRDREEKIKSEEVIVAKRKIELELEYRKKTKELEAEYEKKQKDLLQGIAKLISGSSV